jgi:hypothetical protein
LHIREYYKGGDPRISWQELYIVTLEDYGIVGWTNQACGYDEESEEDQEERLQEEQAEEDLGKELKKKRQRQRRIVEDELEEELKRIVNERIKSGQKS